MTETNSRNAIVGRATDLVAAAKECREACAACFRVLVSHGLAERTDQEFSAAGVKNGFGVRIQEAIKEMESSIAELEDKT